jgi:hypothetical protein
MRSQTAGHRWRFFRAGGVFQARVESGADLRAIGELDLKIWVALSCPVKGLEFDERTLALLDQDADGRIRAPEIIEAAKWICGTVRDPEVLVPGPEAFDLAWIDESRPEGARLLATARRILAGHGRPDAGTVTIGDVTEASGILARAALNGDGVQPPGVLEDPAVAALAREILDCVGGEPDRSGEAGVSQATLDRFSEELAAYDAWRAEAEADAATVLPLGDRTGEAFEALAAIRVKVEDFFARCRLAVFDSRAAGPLNRPVEDFERMASLELAASTPEIAAFPLARIEAGHALPLVSGINPAWVQAVGRFREATVDPLAGRGRIVLTETDWAATCARLAPYEAWLSRKKGAAVERLGPARIREILGSGARAALRERIDADAAIEPEMKAIVEVERLVRFSRDLVRLLNNFLSFADFYSRKRKASFQAGTLYIDGRACELCVAVDDPAKHASLAGLSRIYLVYCDCIRSQGEKRTIVAAITNGNGDRLMVGRNGVFFDRKGRDWDATITRVVENPLSIRQAFFSPYKKVVRMVEEFVAKRALSADSLATEKMARVAIPPATPADPAKPPADPPKKFEIGTVAALGVAVGGITAALGMVLQAFFDLGPWMPLGIVGLMLMISGPSMLLTWLKLRQRNLGPVLDASGWAVNSFVRISTPFGAALTSLGRLPPGSERSLADPYAERRSPWPLIVLLVLLLAAAIWILHDQGILADWLGQGVGTGSQ